MIMGLDVIAKAMVYSIPHVLLFLLTLIKVVKISHLNWECIMRLFNENLPKLTGLYYLYYYVLIKQYIVFVLTDENN